MMRSSSLILAKEVRVRSCPPSMRHHCWPNPSQPCPIATLWSHHCIPLGHHPSWHHSPQLGVYHPPGGVEVANVARPQCLAPSLAKTTGLAVYRISLLTMSSALVGQDHWGLLPIRLAHEQCWYPCGVTAIWLAVDKLVARPRSCALIGCNRCWLAFQLVARRNVYALVARPPFGLLFQE